MSYESLTNLSEYFFSYEKNNIKWRRRRKNLRVRCKNLAFYTTEPLKRTLFCGAKSEKWRRRQKKIKEQPFPKGTPLVQPRFYQAGKKCGEKNRVRPNLGTTFTERPGEKCRFFFPLQISLFFFFFFLKTSFWKNWFSKPVFLTTLIPCFCWSVSACVPEAFALSTSLCCCPQLLCFHPDGWQKLKVIGSLGTQAQSGLG